MSRLRGLSRRFAERGSGTSTQRSSGTVASDIERQAPTRIDKVDHVWALRNAVLRYETTVCARTNRPGMRGIRLITKAERRVAQLESAQARTRSYLSTPRVKAAMAAVTAHDRASAMLGHLVAWVMPIGVLLYVAMGLSDPGYVLAATRRALQVAPSTSTWDLTNRDNLIALAAALAVSTILLITIKAAAAGITSILFWGSLAKHPNKHPEMAHTASLITPWQRVALTIPALTVIFFLTNLLHDMASGQFTNKQAMALSTLNGTGASREALVSLVSNLSWLILAIEVIAHVPALEHARRINRWALKLRLLEAISIRRDQRARRRIAASLARADQPVTLVEDIIADTARRLRADIIEAGIRTGALPHELEVDPGRGHEPEQLGSSVSHLVPINDTGRPDVRLDAEIPPASARVARLLNRYAELRQVVAGIRGIEVDWHDARLADGTYCGIEAVGSGTCLAPDVVTVAPGPDQPVAGSSGRPDDLDLGLPVAEQRSA